MHQEAGTARGLLHGGSTVFRQHWIVAAIAQALQKHHLFAGSENEGACCRDII